MGPARRCYFASKLQIRDFPEQSKAAISLLAVADQRLISGGE
jgi:hypothetical protein